MELLVWLPPAPHGHESPHRRRATAWIIRHWRAALAHMLRGACHGMGTEAIGLAFMWAEQRLC
ncbi:hypothetical protein ABT072_44490 [Streptomyces sp. NPDC002589]|uniref:hypothetical protein n=1 Tax=Streptomyces sp. NPDC002589 TaxID=3154420 RepID=UPI00332C22B5